MASNGQILSKNITNSVVSTNNLFFYEIIYVDWIDMNKIANNCKIGILETED